MILLFLGLHADHSPNELCKQCVGENNFVRSSLVKLQSSLLSVLKIAPKYCIVMRSPSISYGAILACDKSQRVFTKPSWLSIGFTTLKNTACLPVLRVTPPGIKPGFTTDLNFFPFPTWQINSVKPSGNNTSSFNARFTLLPECPWIARRYHN